MLLLAPEEDKTKGNAAGALSNLVRNSDLLCQDIVSQGAIQVCQVLTSTHASKSYYGSTKPQNALALLFTEKWLTEENITICHDF